MASSTSWLRRAGFAAAGLAGAALTTRLYHRQLPPPTALPPALNATSRIIEGETGRIHLYHRPGTGRPLVLLHSLNAVASPMEVRPIFERFATATNRPLYAVDWPGFGRSDRPNYRYTPDTYHDALYAVLNKVVREEPADLVACSIGCEFAASVALQAAPLVHRCVFIAPTGLSANRGPSPFGRLAVKTAATLGAFTAPYFWLTRPQSLRRYLSTQVFLDAIPEALIRYGAHTARIHGAPYAPRYFVDGSLFQRKVDTEVYARLYRPTLLLTPQTPDPTVQRFDRLPALLDANPDALSHAEVPGGLLPQWERPTSTLNAITAFLKPSPHA